MGPVSKNSHDQAVEELSRAVRQFMRKMMQADATLARKLKIHVTDLLIIDFVSSATEPVTPKGIMEQTGLSSGAVTAAIDRIEKAGYLRRRPNPEDRRGVLLVPAGGGTEGVMRAFRQVRERYRRDLSGFSTEELALVTRFLNTI